MGYAVQFKDELISKRFPPESGFEATYRFTVERQVPRPLEIVIERPDLYAITCNGTPVAARKGAWWLDKAFGRIDITAAAKVGANTVTIKAAPMTIYHELEPAYLLGDFAVEPRPSGFAVRRLSRSVWPPGTGRDFPSMPRGSSTCRLLTSPSPREAIAWPSAVGMAASPG